MTQLNKKVIPPYFIPIRDHILIEVRNLPYDLSKNEAEKVSAILSALASPN